MHGDYQFRNVMFANDLPARLVSVIDWELATIGDPLIDLGWLLIRWFEAGEIPPEGPEARGLLTALPGMPTRAELAQRYADGTGRSLEHLDYYQVLAQFKLAVIMEARSSRTGPTPDDDAPTVGVKKMVDNMFCVAAATARIDA
jgi:aminoglycoside phosphotransferase (APT) family kinase protein